jgi:hypothetical protein
MFGHPPWDQKPLDAAFDMLRLDQAPDRGAFLALHGPPVRAIATTGVDGCSATRIAALSQGQIAGAALDVFEKEPAFGPRFLALDNVVLQPHAASGTTEPRQAMGQLMRDNLTVHFAGRPLVTPVTA